MTAAEKLIGRGVQLHDPDGTAYGIDEWALAIQKAASAAPVIYVQNVFDYMQTLASDGISVTFKKKELPGAFPPWTRATVTWDFPSGLQCAAFIRNQNSENTQAIDGDLAELPAGWPSTFFVMEVFISVPRAPQVRWEGSCLSALDSDGVIGEEMVRTAEYREPYVDGLKLIWTAQLITTMTMSFCNCRNVDVTKRSVSRQVLRRSARTGELVVAHHVLSINKISKIISVDGKLRESGDLARAMHICRGHFASYGEEFQRGKLFGKLEGRYWIPQHVRGSAGCGVITKDYIPSGQIFIN